MTIGIVGLGRLGESLARGLARGGAATCGFNRSAAKGREVAARAPGLELLGSAREVFERCDPVFVWMKPADAAAVLAECHEPIAARRPMLVSCAQGVPLAEHTDRWAETIPNVALATGRGVTLIAYGPRVSSADRAQLAAVLAPTGAVHELPAAEIPYYTALSSCGPGLYARMMQLFADTLADRRGYDRDLCRRMVHDTMAGTLALQELDGIGDDEVVWRVAHPGGSTEKGLAVLDAQLPAVAEAMLRNMRKW
jgi:pyrroline-5-carboxylate reductase